MRDVVQRYAESPPATQFTSAHLSISAISMTIRCASMSCWETQRERLSNALEVHLSHISNTLNQVMKRLTAVATIFMPADLSDRFLWDELRTAPLPEPLALVLALIADGAHPRWHVAGDAACPVVLRPGARGQIRDLGGEASVSVSLASTLQQLLHSAPEFPSASRASLASALPFAPGTYRTLGLRLSPVKRSHVGRGPDGGAVILGRRQLRRAPACIDRSG